MDFSDEDLNNILKMIEVVIYQIETEKYFSTNEEFQIMILREKIKSFKTKSDGKSHYVCAICKTNSVDAENGFDTCNECLNRM